MELQTKIEIEKPENKLDYYSRILLLGSCFTENIGNKLDYYRFDCNINPFGILYNPASLGNALNFILKGRLFTEEDVIKVGDKWISLYHHGSFSSSDKEETLRNINTKLETAITHLKKTDWLILTFGTSWVYRYYQTGEIVSNCHKIPAKEFTRYRLTVEELVNSYNDIIQQLKHLNKNLKIVFTVSPIRHWKDGAHGNQLSKSVLLLAIEEIIKQNQNIYYFPAYEIVMDELRDYRFYAEDMLHIGNNGIEYIWERFLETYMEKGTLEIMKQVEKINKSISHRPLYVSSENYIFFQKNLTLQIEKLKSSYPNINFRFEDFNNMSK